MSSPLNDAAQFAQTHEVLWPRGPRCRARAPGQAPWESITTTSPPFNRLRGPVLRAWPASGVVRQHRRGRQRWGEPGRADLTFSVAKSYLALLAGVAAARRASCPTRTSASSAACPASASTASTTAASHGRTLLTQTSEWQGSCLRPARHGRPLAQGGAGPAPRRRRPKAARAPPQAPGTYWEYNDVRINQLALRAAAPCSRGPCPRSSSSRGAAAARRRRRLRLGRLRRRLDRSARRRPRALGSGRIALGRGVSISARDQARIGQLLLDGGVVVGRALRRAPSGSNAWRRLPDRAVVRAPALAESQRPRLSRVPRRASRSWSAPAATTWIDPELDAVVVLRWLDPQHANAAISASPQRWRRVEAGTAAA